MLFLDLYALADVLWKLGKFFFNCSTCNCLQYNFFAIKQSFIHAIYVYDKQVCACIINEYLTRGQHQFQFYTKLFNLEHYIIYYVILLLANKMIESFIRFSFLLTYFCLHNVKLVFHHSNIKLKHSQQFYSFYQILTKYFLILLTTRLSQLYQESGLLLGTMNPGFLGSRTAPFLRVEVEKPLRNT